MREWWKDYAEYRNEFSAWDDLKFTALSFGLPILAVVAVCGLLVALALLVL